MSLLRSAALALPLHLALAFPLMAADPLALDSEEQKLSYALGLLYGARISETFPPLTLDNAAVIAGVAGALGEGDAQMSDEEAQVMLQAFAQKLDEMAKAETLAKETTFFAENGAKEGIVTTESGLQYKIVTTGEGDAPLATDTVSVHYEGRLLDGTVFDSSYARGEPAQFPVGGVIQGWVEALQLMTPGAKFELWIPSGLAYGERGSGRAIGPNEILNFDVELLEIVK